MLISCLTVTQLFAALSWCPYLYCVFNLYFTMYRHLSPYSPSFLLQLFHCGYKMSDFVNKCSVKLHFFKKKNFYISCFFEVFNVCWYLLWNATRERHQPLSFGYYSCSRVKTAATFITDRIKWSSRSLYLWPMSTMIIMHCLERIEAKTRRIEANEMIYRSGAFQQ